MEEDVRTEFHRITTCDLYVGVQRSRIDPALNVVASEWASAHSAKDCNRDESLGATVSALR